FFPAGHVIGSAQIKLEYKGFVAVVSGDYKLQDDGLSVPFHPVKCHEFVTESTFGLPIYHWDVMSVKNRKLEDWVSLNWENGKTSVLVGYSLGKAQRILKALESNGNMVVYNSLTRLNSALVEPGIELPSNTVIYFTHRSEMQGAT